MIASLYLKKSVLRLLVLCLATAGMFVACQDVTVSPVDVASLDLTPNQLTLTPGEQRQLTVRLLGNDGSPLPDREIQWSSTNSDVVEVDGDGTVQGIAPGAATIEASSAGVTDATEVAVVAGVTLQLTPDNLDFSAPEGGSSPPARTVDVVNAGTGSLGGLSASISYSAGDPHGWLDVELNGNTAPAELSVSVSPGSLEEGVYTATIEVRSPDAENSPREVLVTFTVGQPAPAISLGTSSVGFGATEGGADPEVRAVSVVNSGAGTLSGLSSSISYSDGEPGGWLSATLEDDEAPTELVLAATTSDLAEGTYSATVEVASGVASNSPRAVNVTFSISTGSPGAPSGLDAAAASASRIDLEWEDNSDNEAEFRIERHDDGSWEQIASRGANATSYSDTGLDESSSHRYRVRACNASGCSDYSNQASATTRPAAPSDLVAEPASATRIDLSWDDDSAGEDEFEIERRVSGGSFSRIQTVAADRESYSDTGLTPSTTYFYRVRACSGAGCSAYSNEASATTHLVAPQTKPSDLEAEATSSSRIELSWTDNSTFETGFAIERRKVGDSFEGVDTVASSSGSSESYADTGLDPATAYTYRVRACNTVGCSDPSNEASATTHLITPQTAPSDLVAEAMDSSRIELSWTDNSILETHFEIEWSKEGGGSGVDTVESSSDTIETYIDSGLDPGTRYTYQVRACNIIGCSDRSNEVSATTHEVPPGTAPSGLSATANSSSEIELEWTYQSANESEFRIERSSEGGQDEKFTVDRDTRRYVDSGLESDTEYTYQILACNEVGCSDPSDEARARTESENQSALGSPSGVRATAVSASEVELTWEDNSSQEDRFEIQHRKNAVGQWRDRGEAVANSTTFHDSDLNANTLYEYRVRACKEGECSEFTPGVEVTTLSAGAAIVQSRMLAGF